MGNSKSKPAAASVDASPVAAASEVMEPGSRKRRLKTLPDHVLPTAGVIGCGLPGLFAARELAVAGFDVTVLDAAPTITAGTTAFGVGAYGNAVPFHLAPWSVNFAREYIRGLLPRSDSPFLSTETPPMRVLDTVAWNWLYQRARDRLIPEPDRSSVISGLKRKTTEIMNEIHKEHPELRRHIIDEREIRPTEPGAEPYMQTIIDVPRWTLDFATILQEDYGVAFTFSKQVTFLQLKLAFDTESVHHLHARNLEFKDSSVIDAYPFDVFVFAAGKKLTRMLWPNYTAPVLELGGCQVDVPLDAPLAQKLQGPYGVSEASNGVVRWGYVRDALNQTKLRVSGLWSPDLRKSEISPEWATYALTRKGKLTQDTVTSVRSLLPEDLTKVDASRYSRGFTPDGLPIVSKFGNCFNAFILGGFGDDVVPFAAGAANLLSRLVLKQMSLEEAKNPLSLHRFGASPPIVTEEKPPWQERLLDWERRTAYLSLDAYLPIDKIKSYISGPKAEHVVLADSFADELPYQRRMRLKAEKKRAEEMAAVAGDASSSSPVGLSSPRTSSA